MEEYELVDIASQSAVDSLRDRVVKYLSSRQLTLDISLFDEELTDSFLRNYQFIFGAVETGVELGVEDYIPTLTDLYAQEQHHLVSLMFAQMVRLDSNASVVLEKAAAYHYGEWNAVHPWDDGITHLLTESYLETGQYGNAVKMLASKTPMFDFWKSLDGERDRMRLGTIRKQVDEITRNVEELNSEERNLLSMLNY